MTLRLLLSPDTYHYTETVTNNFDHLLKQLESHFYIFRRFLVLEPIPGRTTFDCFQLLLRAYRVKKEMITVTMDFQSVQRAYKDCGYGSVVDAIEVIIEFIDRYNSKPQVQAEMFAGDFIRYQRFKKMAVAT